MVGEIRDLVQRAAAGEKKAVNALIDQVHPLVWRILKKFSTLSPAEREDLSQDVFVILLTRGLQSFRGSTDHEFHWYVKTITENETKSYLRKRGRRLEVRKTFFNLTPSAMDRLRWRRCRAQILVRLAGISRLETLIPSSRITAILPAIN